MTVFRIRTKRPLLVSVVSFGFRYGIPTDADLVFDVRFLPNPHFIPRLRPFSGKDPRVARYIRSFPQTKEFLRRIESLLGYLIPHYIREGKSYLTVAMGCTGGRHRSVALAEVIRRSLQRKGYAAKVVHRDIGQVVILILCRAASDLENCEFGIVASNGDLPQPKEQTGEDAAHGDSPLLRYLRALHRLAGRRTF